MNNAKIKFTVIAASGLLCAGAFAQVTQTVADPTSNNGSFEASHATGLLCEYLTNPLGIDIACPRFSWKIQTSEANFRQTAYEVRVAEAPDLFNQENKRVWNSGKVMSDQSVNIEYKGPQLESKKRYYWQVRIWDSKQNPSSWSGIAWWETAMFDSALWKAEWIVAEGKTPADHRPVYFRKEFDCAKKIQSARLYITSLGLNQVFLNGEKVSSDLFAPGWTSYNKRLQYQTYDITAMLKAENAIGAVVGDGWYRGNIVCTKAGNYWGDKLSLLAQIEIVFTDGTEKKIITDASWQTGNGPIIEADIYNGETYDATQELPEWNQPGFVSKTFSQAKIFDHPRNILVAPRSYPVRAITEIKAIKMITTPKGEIVYDLGQNMVGWVRLKVKGQKGDSVILKFAEVLDKQGNFYTANLRDAKATDKYILKGGGEEVFEPHFTYHGFRYVKLEHFPGTPDLTTITGIVIHSAMPLTGSFVCSDPLINQLQHNIQWTQRGNFLAVPTDCPQRNERLGWIGSVLPYCQTASFNFNVAPFYSNWVLDIAADQFQDGAIPGTAPDALHGNGLWVGCSDGAVVVPWRVYQAYGDIRILQTQYPSMKAWVEFVHKKAGGDNLWIGVGGYVLGDWLAFATNDDSYPGATTDKDFIANACYFFSTEKLAQIAATLGKTEDARKYEELAHSIKKAFQHEYVTPAGRLVSNTQCAYAMALSFGLMPDSLVSQAANHLAEDITQMKHLTTGATSTYLLCRTLSDHGYADLAFMLLTRKEYPSWLYMVTQGATTVWERWDGQKSDGSFQTVNMNSFNHCELGAIGEWLYTYVAGISIDPQAPGYKHFFLQPHPGGGLTSASADLETGYGTIKSTWKIEGDKMINSCSVPPNSSATVCFEQAEEKGILLNNLPLPKDGSFKVSTENGKIRIEIGSGSYSFSSPCPALKK